MTGYLVRRFIQMLIVVFLSAFVSYVILNLAPGGPLAGLSQIQQSSRFRVTAEDIARIRAVLRARSLLSDPFRALGDWSSPRGPIKIGSLELFANTPIGCRQIIQGIIMSNRQRSNSRILVALSMSI